MKNFILKWFIGTIALLVVVHLFSGVKSENLLVTIITALVLALLNTFLKPIVNFFAFPFQIITLGLFTLIINAFMFYLAGELVRGFYVAGFWTAFWAALVYSIVTILINFFISPKKSSDKY